MAEPFFLFPSSLWEPGKWGPSAAHRPMMRASDRKYFSQCCLEGRRECGMEPQRSHGAGPDSKRFPRVAWVESRRNCGTRNRPFHIQLGGGLRPPKLLIPTPHPYREKVGEVSHRVFPVQPHAVKRAASAGGRPTNII